MPVPQYNAPQNSLGRNQKMAAAALAVFAVFFIIMWGLQFRKNLSDPLNSDNFENQNNGPIEDGSAALKTKDTDKDGLSDWDELNIYKTSPYLPDSDSDGIPDGQEIKNGTDANCPEGRKCSDSLIDSELPSESQNPAPSISNIEDKSLLDILGGSSSASDLRKALLEAGMDQKMLDQISDENLIKSYQDTLRGMNKVQ